MKPNEQRESQRIKLEVPINLNTGVALSRDISWSGIYFVTDHRFSIGTDIQFTLELDYVLPGKPLNFNCSGQIVRVDKVGEQLGVAACIEEFSCLH
jgi:hypothetical protein